MDSGNNIKTTLQKKTLSPPTHQAPSPPLTSSRSGNRQRSSSMNLPRPKPEVSRERQRQAIQRRMSVPDLQGGQTRLRSSKAPKTQPLQAPSYPAPKPPQDVINIGPFQLPSKLKKSNMRQGIEYIHKGMRGDYHYEKFNKTVPITRNNTLRLQGVTRPDDSIEVNSFVHFSRNKNNKIGKLTATTLHEFGAHVLHGNVVMDSKKTELQDHAFIFNKHEPYGNRNDIYLGWGRKVFNAIDNPAQKRAFANEFFSDIQNHLNDVSEDYQIKNPPDKYPDSAYDLKVRTIKARRESMLDAIGHPDQHSWTRNQT